MFKNLVGLSICMLAIASPAYSNCLDDAAKFAERVCGEISKEGTSSSASAKAAADAKANSILARIIGSGSASLSADYAREDYVGVVREQLTNDRFSARDCRVRMVKVAIDQGCKAENLPDELKKSNSTEDTAKFVKIDSILR